jgi:hypothetical protein
MIQGVATRATVPAHHLGQRAVFVGVGISFTMALLGGLIFSQRDEPSSPINGGAWATVALAMLIAAPGLLALLGNDRRPWVLGAAGLILLPMCFLSFSFLFFPLLVPAAMFFTVAVSRPRDRPRPWAQSIAAIVAVVFVVAAAVSLWAHQDAVTSTSSTSSTGSSSASDVITRQEALTALGFLVAAFVVAALAPRDGDQTG